MPRAIVVGSITVDEQRYENGAVVLQLGGVATYGTLAFKEAGVPVVAICNLGGRYAERARAAISSLGISVRAEEAPATTVFRNHVRADGSREQELLSVAPPIGRKALDEVASDADLVHLGPLHASDIGQDLIDSLRGMTVTVTLDLQGLLRSSRLGSVQAEISPGFERALIAATIVKAASGEVATIERVLGLSAPELARHYDIDELVVTLGALGGYVLTADGTRIEYEAAHADRVVDPTGAGDVFFATYVRCRLFERMPMDAACRTAAHLAALHVSGNFIGADRLRLPRG